MSTTFNPHALVVMVALINTNKEIIMIKHSTEQNHTCHTHGQKQSCWCFKAFHILQLFLLWLNLDLVDVDFCIDDALCFQLDVFFPHEVVLHVHLEKFGSAVVAG